MYGVNKPNSTMSNLPATYSPVTLSDGWPKVGRLIFMVTLSTLGSTLNGFFVASFFVENSLRKVGFVFLACVGIADLFITGGAMPISSVVLLSGEWDNIYVCNVVHFLGVTATYCYSLFFMFVAAEAYVRLCCSKSTYNILITCNVPAITVSIFAISFVLSGTGVYLGLDYDYCNREYSGNSYYRIISTTVFHILPSITTIFCLVSSFVRIRKRATEELSYKRSLAYGRDNSIAMMNIAAYLLYFFAWLPYLVASVDLSVASDAKYYNSVWFGHARSVLTSFLYGILNRNFRRAFAHLFNYCCCKSTLSGHLTTRYRKEYSTRMRNQNPNRVCVRSAAHPLFNMSPRPVTTIRDVQVL